MAEPYGVLPYCLPTPVAYAGYDTSTYFELREVFIGKDGTSIHSFSDFQKVGPNIVPHQTVWRVQDSGDSALFILQSK
jgi:hypothetical protein